MNSTDAQTSLPSKRTTLAVLFMMFLSAVHTMVMHTLLAPVLAEFDCLEQAPWATSSFLLASMGTMPIYGLLSDRWGAQRVCILATLLFGFASFACGAAPSFWVLVLARAFQGSGSSGMLVSGYVYFGRLNSPARRPAALGMLSAACALAMYTGPSLASWAASSWDWRMAFYLLLPSSLLCVGLLRTAPKLCPSPVTARFDGVGALLFLLSAVLVNAGLLAMTAVAPKLADFLPVVLGAFCMIYFVRRCWIRTPSYIAFDLCRDHSLRTATLVGFLTGAVMFSFPYLVSMYVQGGLGLGAARAGQLTLPVSIGWIIGSLLCGQMIGRYGLRIALASGLLCYAGCYHGLLICMHSGALWVLGGLSALCGLGLGLCIAGSLCAGQTLVTSERLGASTSLINLTRILGGAWGGALISASQIGWTKSLWVEHPSLRYLDILPKDLLEPVARHGMHEETLLIASQLFSDSIAWVAMSSLFLIYLLALLVWRMPAREKVYASGAVDG
jgi:MFS family permease